jgi:hypothetical protein
MRRLVLITLISALFFPSVLPVHATALTCAQGGTCIIGDTGPGGGIVFFVKQVGSFEESFTVSDGMGMSRTYTVALTSSQQAALPFDYLEFAPTGRGGGTWGTNGAITNNTSLLIGTGESNTDDILLTQTGVAANNAARYAKDYVNNGRTDWFLPSYQELLLMMLRVKLGTFPTSYFPDGLWASSTGGDNTTAYYSALGQLQGNVNRLATTPGVRPIRAFSAMATTAPDAPTIGSVTALSPTSASVAFTAPTSNGGATIETYTATSTPGSITRQIFQSGSGSIIVTGLTSSTAYTFRVTASNSVGTSTSSSASISITTPATNEELAAQKSAADRAAAAKREADKKSARAEILSKFKSPEKVMIETFNQAEIAGITNENIDELHTEIFALPEESRVDITRVLKVARKYEVVGIIASERVKTIYSNSLIEIGLMPADSKHKAALTEAIKNLPVNERSSYAAIKAALNAEMAEIQGRKDRLAAILALIASHRNS